MSSKKHRSQKVSSNMKSKINWCFHQVYKAQPPNPSIPQTMGPRTGPEDISQNKISYNISDVYHRGKKKMKYMLTCNEKENSPMVLDTPQPVKERETQQGREMLVGATEGSEGYINHRSPFRRRFPENGQLEVTFAQSKSEQNRGNQVCGQHGKASTDCGRIGKKRKRAAECEEPDKEEHKVSVCAFEEETVKDGRFLFFMEKDDRKLTKNLDSIVQSTVQVDELERKFSQLEVEKRWVSRAAATQDFDLPVTQNSELEERNPWVLKGEIVAQGPSLKRETEKIKEKSKEEAKERAGEAFRADKTNCEKLTKNSNSVEILKLFPHFHNSIGYLQWDKGKGGCATCFVFRGLFIFTCQHVIKSIVGKGTERDEWAGIIGKHVRVTFDYKDSQRKRNYFFIEPWFEVADGGLDYAVLKLKENGHQVPVGLYNRIGPMPINGLIHIIGHPDGKAKSTDSCAIIPQSQRERKYWEHLQARAVEGYDVQDLHAYHQRSFQKIVPRADVITYNTTFYYGSSGSPVFDSEGFLVAMHSAGFAYKYPRGVSSIIEFGCTMQSIIQNIEENHRIWLEKLGITQQDVEMVSDED